MGVPNLSDGTPLSYEWLNQIADTINKLEIQNADDSNVKFVGVINGDDIQVLTGEYSFTVPATQVKGAVYYANDIAFDAPFASNPVVVATVRGGSDNKAYPAGVAVTGITTTQFDAVVQRFNDNSNMKNAKINISYIAIGKKQA